MNAAAIKRLVQLAEHSEFVSVYSPHLAALCRLALAARQYEQGGVAWNRNANNADELRAAISAVFGEETTR